MCKQPMLFEAKDGSKHYKLVTQVPCHKLRHNLIHKLFHNLIYKLKVIGLDRFVADLGQTTNLSLSGPVTIWAQPQICHYLDLSLAKHAIETEINSEEF